MVLNAREALSEGIQLLANLLLTSDDLRLDQTRCDEDAEGEESQGGVDEERKSIKIQPVRVWNDSVHCGDVKAIDRKAWLIENRRMNSKEAETTVMEEFPNEFVREWRLTCGGDYTLSLKPNMKWNPNAFTGSYKAHERVNWLVKKRSMDKEDAVDQVMNEYPNIFIQGWYLN